MEYTEENYKNAKKDDIFEFTCQKCGKIFVKTKREIQKNSGRPPKCCSSECGQKLRDMGEIEVTCAECGKKKTIKVSEYNKSENKMFFCNHSCAAEFNGKHRNSTTKGKTKVVKCSKCGREIEVSIHLPKSSWYCDDCIKTFICPFCKKICKNPNSLAQHIRFCKDNPNHEISNGNGGKMPNHTHTYYDSPMIYNHEELDITREQFDKYQEKQTTCEICGRTIEEAVVTQHKFQAKRFCLDHNHDTHQFRGLLCSCCNRQLGWYEKYRIQISKYLDKDLSEQNKNI
jgi:ribosomal protein L34E